MNTAKNLSLDMNTVRGGILGVCTGDALGVPVEFSAREARAADPVTGMRGPSAPYYQPPGTWSDDSSMMLATTDALVKEGCSLKGMMDRFVRWREGREYNPHGRLFDIGNTCAEAIDEYRYSGDTGNCGMRGQGYNGNGSLMRILPASLWALKHCETRAELVDTVHRISALTHAHPISMMACGIYTRLVEAILRYKAEGGDLQARLQAGIALAKEDYVTLKLGDLYADGGFDGYWVRYFRKLEKLEEFADTDEDDIKSGGFSVDTLRAALWCLLNTASYGECVLKAVNLGKDTDTTAAVAGGLAGLLYGEAAIDAGWLGALARKSWLDGMADAFAGCLGVK